MAKHRYLWLPVWLLSSAALFPLVAQTQDVIETPRGETVERNLPTDEPLRPWAHDPNLLRKESGDRVEMRLVHAEHLATVKLTDVVPPIRFDSGVADIPQTYIESLRKALDDLRDRRNVRLHLVGHADDQPLSGRARARVRRQRRIVARACGRSCGVPAESPGAAGRGSFVRMGRLDAAGRDQHDAGRAALNRRVEVQVWYDETQAALSEEEVLVKDDFKRVKVCRMETVCKMRFKGTHRTRIRNLVQPLLYDEAPVVSEAFVANIKGALENLQEKQHVTVKLIGFTDNVPLTDRNERIYGNHLALSGARAHRVALELEEALGLPNEVIVSDGRGSSSPVATNNTAQGRAANRRIEVEFWHDDPLTELPDEPRLCPGAPGSEVVTRVYDPPWGPIEPLQLEQGGRAMIPADYAQQLRRAMTDIADRTNVRLRFIGYTKNERLDRRTAIVYGDDIGLAAAARVARWTPSSRI